MTAIPIKLLRSLKKVFMNDPADSHGAEYHYTMTRDVGRSSELGRGDGGLYNISGHICMDKITLQLSDSRTVVIFQP